MLTACNIEFKGPFAPKFWEGMEEECMKPIEGCLKVLGSGMTPFSACLRACAEARHLGVTGHNYGDFVGRTMNIMMDRCPYPFQVPAHDQSQRFYIVLTMTKQ
jgi:hypothetical protein